MKFLLASFTSLSAIVLAAHAAIVTDGALWDSGYRYPDDTTVCAPASSARDDNNICFIPDGPVVLGLNFQVSPAALITGARIYRVEEGDVTGSLVRIGDGAILASGKFSGSATHKWSDLVFDSPIPVTSEATYMVHYSANSHYAYQHDCPFPISSLGGTPQIKAMEGLFCSTNCLPNQKYEDSNYWITPLWGHYAFTGFAKPVDNGSLNKAKAGSAIPVKFSLGGNHGTTNIFRSGYPKVIKVDCLNNSVGRAENKPATSNGFTYDAASDQYNYVWKTDKEAAGQCYQFELGLNDGSSRTFKVQFS